MKTEQKVFRLGCESGNSISITDKLFLVVNGEKTKIPVEEFFRRYEQEENYLCGYSIFGDKTLLNQVIQVPSPDGSNIQVNFWNRNTDEELFVTRIKNPLIQMPDKDLDENKYIELLMAEVAIQKGSTTEEIKEELKVEIEAEKEKLPENQLVEKEKEEEEEEEEEEPIVCEKYEKDRIQLIEKGYKEFVIDDMRLLVEEKEGGRMALCLLTKDDYKRIKIEESKKTEKGYDVGVKRASEEGLTWISFY